MNLPKVFDESFIDSPKRNKNLLPQKITLTELYESGYFITEVFGTRAVIVKHVTYEFHKEAFSCSDRQVEFGPNYDETIQHIERIAAEKWEKYKKLLVRAE